MRVFDDNGCCQSSLPSAGAAVRLPEPGRVAVSPHRLAGGRVVAGDDLVLTALLLRVEAVAANREGRPARPDGAAPQLDRRRRRPVGGDPHAADDAVAPGPSKAGPVGSGLRRRRSRRERRRLVAGLSQKPLLGSLRPTPVEVRIGVAGHAAGPQEREHTAREHDGSDQRCTPQSAGEPTGGDRPGDEREAQGRDGVDGEHIPHHPARNGRVNNALCDDDRDDHQHDGAHALGPGRPAEEQPPHDDRQPEGDCAKRRDYGGVARDDGQDEP